MARPALEARCACPRARRSRCPGLDGVRPDPVKAEISGSLVRSDPRRASEDVCYLPADVTEAPSLSSLVFSKDSLEVGALLGESDVSVPDSRFPEA